MKLKPVKSIKDIPSHLKGTPVEALLEFQNLKKPFKKYKKAQLLVSMCMDNRKQLRIPENFAYILRTGGGNVRYSEFKVSYAIAIGDLKTVVLIAHDKCGMSNLMKNRKKFVDGLAKNAGWPKEKALEHFMNFAPMFEIGDEIEFVLSETERIKSKYPNIQVVPLFYKLADGLLYLIES